MGKNVLIPTTLVKRIIELLRYWDVSGYDRFIREDYGEIMHRLHVKLKKLEARDAYAKIIAADNEDAQDDARMEYLWQRARLTEMSADDF